MSNSGKENGLYGAGLIFICFCFFYAAFFSPIVFGGRVFGSDGQLASFYSSMGLWSDAWAGGWPIAADLTQMMFSPMRILFGLMPHGFNIFVVSSYVLISVFMCGYMYALTKSYFAGAVSGLVLGLSGFMMAHLGHTGIISGAAWMPLLLWALEKIRQGYQPLWLGFGVLSVCVMLLSGHPQITVYSYLIGIAYAFVRGFEAKQGKWRYWLVVFCVFVLGLGLAAIQWLPTYELSKNSFRNTFSYDEFISFSLPLAQLPMLVSPFFYGSQHGIFFSTNYFGAWSYTELAGYAGVLGLVLSAVSVTVRRDPLTLFWVCIAFVAIMLALGGSLPWLSKLAYSIPVLNKFRVPSRHIYEFVLAVSVLAGLGTAALEGAVVCKERLKKLMLGLAVICAFFVLAAVCINFAPCLLDKSPSLNILSTKNLTPSLFYTGFWVACSFGILFIYYKNIFVDARKWILLLAVMAEMASFGWYHEWRSSGFGPPLLWNEEVVLDYSNRANESQQRLVSQKGLAVPPDAGRLSGVHSLNWYGPLLLKNYSDSTGVNTSGVLDVASLSDKHVGLDIFGGRYLFVDPAEKIEVDGLRFFKEPLGFVLGDGCGLNLPVRRLIKLVKPVPANQLALVTQLGCSSAFVDGQQAGEVVLNDIDGRATNISLRAGMETSEWSIDCQNDKNAVSHGKASVFNGNSVDGIGGKNCANIKYVAKLPFPRGEVDSIEIKSSRNVTLNIHHLTLSDGQTGASHSIRPEEEFLSSSRWNLLQTIGDVSVYENLRALPPVWMVFQTIKVSPEQALSALRSSILPDGSKFYPDKQVLVEDDIALDYSNAEGEATLVHRDDRLWEIAVQSSAPGFLVIGQNYYPGWKASLDDKPVEVIKANYSQQGVRLPPGSHKLVLTYSPDIFKQGALISAVCLIVLFLLVFRGRRYFQ